MGSTVWGAVLMDDELPERLRSHFRRTSLYPCNTFIAVHVDKAKEIHT